MDGDGSTVSVEVVEYRTVAPPGPVASSVLSAGTPRVGAVVTFSVSATDIASSPVTTVCSKSSGSGFSIGATTVTCTAKDTRGNTTVKSFTVTVTSFWTYSGFTDPVKMGASYLGLSGIVNKVAGGRNVSFKWTVKDVATGKAVTNPALLQFKFMNYADFRNQFIGLPNWSSLPYRNVCLDTGRKVGAIASGTGATTTLKYTLGKFTIGYKVPAKPTGSTINCFVAFTRVIGDANPGIVALFTLS